MATAAGNAWIAIATRRQARSCPRPSRHVTRPGGNKADTITLFLDDGEVIVLRDMGLEDPAFEITFRFVGDAEKVR